MIKFLLTLGIFDKKMISYNGDRPVVWHMECLKPLSMIYYEVIYCRKLNDDLVTICFPK